MNTKRYVTFILSVAVVLTMLLSGCGPTPPSKVGIGNQPSAR